MWGSCIESVFCSKISLKIARMSCNFEACFCSMGFVCVQGIAAVVPASLIETEACRRIRIGSWNLILQQKKTLLVNKREQNPVFSLHPQRWPGRCCELKQCGLKFYPVLWWMSLKAAAASPVLLYSGCLCFKIWLWELRCIIQPSCLLFIYLFLSYVLPLFTSKRIIDSKILKDC